MDIIEIFGAEGNKIFHPHIQYGVSHYLFIVNLFSSGHSSLKNAAQRRVVRSVCKQWVNLYF